MGDKTMTALMPYKLGASAYTEVHPQPERSLGDTSRFVTDVGDRQTDDWGRVLEELKSFRTLEDDWDGNGAVAPPPSLVDGAITLALSLRADLYVPPDRVVAGVNGSVFFEWHSQASYQEVEVTSPIMAEWRKVHRSSQFTEVRKLVRLN
jgi:hypothetical protein